MGSGFTNARRATSPLAPLAPLARAALVLAATLGSAACSKSQPPPAQPMMPATTSAPVAPGPYPGQPAQAPQAQPQPQPQPVAVDPVTLAIDTALDVALLARADKDAPGMKPEGQPLRVTMKESDLSAMVVTLHPGRCYTIIAMSAPLQVSELEVHLSLLPFNVLALSSSPKDKNPAFIGKGNAPTCPAVPLDVQYRIDVIAKRGAGRVVAQVFSRPK